MFPAEGPPGGPPGPALPGGNGGIANERLDATYADYGLKDVPPPGGKGGIPGGPIPGGGKGGAPGGIIPGPGGNGGRAIDS